MDYGTFRERFGAMAEGKDRADLLLAFSEENMQTCPGLLLPLLEEERDRALAGEQPVLAARCIRVLGWLAVDQADFPSARAHFDRAKTLFAGAGDQPGILKALNGTASVESALGNLETALEVYREAITLAVLLGDPVQTEVLRTNIGVVLLGLGQFSEAEEHLRGSLEPGLLGPLNESIMVAQWAKACLRLGRKDEAREALDRAIALARAGRFHSSLSIALDLRGTAALEAGDLTGAAGFFTEAAAEGQAAGDLAAVAQAFLDEGKLLRVQGDLEAAETRFREALDLGRGIGTMTIEAEAWGELSKVLKDRGSWKEALEAHESFHDADLRFRTDRVSRQVAQLRADQVRRETDLLKDQTRMLSLLGDIGRKVTASLNLESIMVTVYEAVGGLMKADLFGVGLFDGEKNLIDFRLVIEDGHRVPRALVSAEADSLSGWCIRHRRKLRIDDVLVEYSRYLESQPPRIGTDGDLCLSCLYTPLVVEGQVLGVLMAQAYPRAAYTDRDMATLETLGTSIAIAIRNAQLFEQVRTLATVDVLTGAATRRFLFERTEEEFRNFLRTGVPLALVMIDLDHFKTLNDQWGHTTGDQILGRFGTLCLGHKRTHDIFGRYGGEEFAMVLSGTDLAGAVTTAARLCAAVRETVFTAGDGTPVKVTASFGVTVFHPGDDGVTRVFSRADEALYAAKQAGRDRVESRSP